MLSIGQNYVLNLIHCMCPFFMLFEENPKELTNAALNEGGKATSPTQLPNLILLLWTSASGLLTTPKS